MSSLAEHYIRAPWWLRTLLLSALFAGITALFAMHSWRAPMYFVACVLLTFAAGMTRTSAYQAVELKTAMSFSTGDATHWFGSSQNSDFASAWVMADTSVFYRSLAVSSVLTSALIAGALLLPLSWWLKIPAAYLAWRLPRSLRAQFTQIERAQLQRERDERARLTMEKLRSAKPVRDYFLYLRPFHVTGRMQAYDDPALAKAKARQHETQFVGETPGSEGTEIPLGSVRIGIGDDGSDDSVNPDLEEILERGVRSYGDLIALGTPGETIGSGRILTSNTNWMREVVQLGSRARALIVMPAANPGTRWELEWLKQERAYRDCLFLMPGLSGGFDGLEYWKRTAQELQPLIQLPRFVGPPALFCFDPRGATCVVPLARKGVHGVGGVTFHAAASEVRRAIRILHPISRGEDDPARAEMVRFARHVAGEIWGKHGVCAWVDQHPARTARTRVGATAPGLAESPLSLTWTAAGIVGVEFQAEPPMQEVSIVVLVKPHRGGGSYVGYGLNMDDADETLLQAGGSLRENATIRRKTLFRVEIPAEKFTGDTRES